MIFNKWRTIEEINRKRIITKDYYSKSIMRTKYKFLYNRKDNNKLYLL